MKQRMFWSLVAALLCALGARAETLAGAGSSAAAPIYQAWAREYQKVSGVALVYEPSGSSAGLKKITAGETGFGASDVAPSEAELASSRLVVFPVAITGIAPVVNLPKIGDGQLRLTGDVLARIFLGQIDRWSAPEIRRLNPGLGLPDMPIRVVARSDGSGTTYNFTDYLSKISPAWKSQYGAKTSIAWPGTALGAKGSAGVVAAVRDTPGAIGYVDFGYVAENRLAAVQLQNGDGEFVRPGVQAFQAALANSDWTSKGSFSSTLTAQSGKITWPITMGTFVLVPQVSDRPELTQSALRFFVWAFNHGDSLVQQASFVRLPDRVQAAAFKVISGVRARSGQAIGLGVL